MKKKILIVGGGLAGSIFALSCASREIDFELIDNKFQWRASSVALGLMNPITGRSFVLSWLYEKLESFAIEFYRNQEAQLGKRFFQQDKLLRILDSPREQNILLGRTTDPAYGAFLSGDVFQADSKILKGNSSGYLFDRIFRLRPSSFLKAFSAKYQSQITSDNFNYSELEVENGVVKYRDKQYSEIVFCEGHHVKDNPFFAELPIATSKGNALIVQMENWPYPFLVKHGVLIAPLNRENKYWIGTNYDRDSVFPEPIPEDGQALRNRFESKVNFPYTLSSHISGIRPTTIDRRPIIGPHPSIKSMFIFNGLGSKGVSLGPYFANELINHIQLNVPLDSSINPNRGNS